MFFLLVLHEVTKLGFLFTGVPQAKRGEVWQFLVEQHRLRYPSIEENTPKVDYSELLKQLTNHQHAILIDLGNYYYHNGPIASKKGVAFRPNLKFIGNFGSNFCQKINFSVATF